MGEKNRGFRERAPVHVQCEPKDNDWVAHQKLSRNTAKGFEDRSAQPRFRAPLPKASRSLRIVRLEASNIGGKLAREVKATDMNIRQAMIY